MLLVSEWLNYDFIEWIVYVNNSLFVDHAMTKTYVVGSDPCMCNLLISGKRYNTSFTDRFRALLMASYRKDGQLDRRVVCVH